MEKSTKIALGSGIGAAACIAGAVYCKKRRQTGGMVACCVAGGCAAVAAAGCAVCACRGKGKRIPREIRELHARAGGGPVDYDAIELHGRPPTTGEVRAAAASVNADMSGYTDAEIQAVINNASAMSLPDGRIYMPQDQNIHKRKSQQKINALLAHEVEHQAQYQNNDARQVFAQLVQEALMDRSVIDPYKTRGYREYEAQQVEEAALRAYALGWRPSAAAGSREAKQGKPE